MKAIILSEFGAPEVLVYGDAPVPEVRPHDLLVRVYAAGINRADLTQRTGGYGWPDYGDSTLMGLEIAGEVVALGEGVAGFQIGDRVMGVVGGGGYAEMARMDFRMAMPIPASLDYVEAAAIPEVFVTANEALIHLGRLGQGDSVLIHAAASGVGSAAVQLARATGAKVFATANGSKHARVQQLGASVVIDYKQERFADVIREKTDRRGVDVIVDFIGEPYFADNLTSLANGGRLVQVGLLGGGGRVAMDLSQVLFRHLHIMGTVMKSRTQAEKHAMTQRFSERWLAHFGDSRGLVPIVDSTFPLARAAEAHRRMETSENVGKIILTMDESTS